MTSDPDDLDALVTELNAGVPRVVVSDQETERLRSWLEHVVERGVSDLLLVAGSVRLQQDLAAQAQSQKPSG